MATSSRPRATYTKPMTPPETLSDYALVIRQAHRNALARREK